MADILPITKPADVLAAAHLFDRQPTLGRATGYLQGDGNHLLIAYVDDVGVGFVSGIEIGHPDKPTEMMLYELAVAENYQRRGIGAELVEALASHARHLGCSAMWAPTSPDNEAAVATYSKTGAAIEDAAIATWDLS